MTELINDWIKQMNNPFRSRFGAPDGVLPLRCHRFRVEADNQSINKSVSQSVSQSICQSVKQSINQSDSQSINQSKKQANKQTNKVNGYQTTAKQASI